MAPGELHLVDLPVFMDTDLQPVGKGIDHAGAHAVETAGDLIAATAELTAGVKHGKHNLQSRLAGLGLTIHGNTTAVIGDGDGISFIDGYGNMLTVASQRLVDGVVHDLIHQMVQTGGGG